MWYCVQGRKPGLSICPVGPSIGQTGPSDWLLLPPVENPMHCDFVKLRTMLVRTHMQDLKDVTRETHYENYRAQCIQSMTRMVVKERNRK